MTRARKNNNKASDAPVLALDVAFSSCAVKELRSLARDGRYATSVLHALMVLAVLPGDGETRRLSDLVAEVGLSRSAVYRHLRTWCVAGFVAQAGQAYRRTGASVAELRGLQRSHAHPDPLIGCLLPRIVPPAWPDGVVHLRRRWGTGSSLILVIHRGKSSRWGGAARYLTRLRSWARVRRELTALRYEVAFLCLQTLDEQRQAVDDPTVGFTLLSDPRLELLQHWPLPLLESERGIAYDEVSLIVHNGEVSDTFYSSGEPKNDVEAILDLIREVHEP